MTNYISHTDSDIREMLEVIGINNISDLFYDIPKGYEKKIDYFSSKSEIDLKKIFYDYANKNVSLNNYISFLGGGAYQHFIPSIINHIAGRSEFYTAYTPYQPEISQ